MTIAVMMNYLTCSEVEEWKRTRETVKCLVVRPALSAPRTVHPPPNGPVMAKATNLQGEDVRSSA